jgi:hypothetical protein
MRDIAIRGFINEKFGNPLGKGLFKRAMYTGSAELRNPNQKYLIDLMEYRYWENAARSDSQIATVQEACDLGLDQEPGILMSWVSHWDPITRSKTGSGGFCVYSPESQEIYLKVADTLNQVQEEWTLNVEHCKTPGLKRPVFVAATVDLTKW